MIFGKIRSWPVSIFSNVAGPWVCDIWEPLLSRRMNMCHAGTPFIPKIKSFERVVCLPFVCLTDDNLLVRKVRLSSLHNLNKPEGRKMGIPLAAL